MMKVWQLIPYIFSKTIGSSLFLNHNVPAILDVESKLLKARMRMQQKYLDQFYMLYDDFHITKLPLLPQEVQLKCVIFGDVSIHIEISL